MTTEWKVSQADAAEAGPPRPAPAGPHLTADGDQTHATPAAARSSRQAPAVRATPGMALAAMLASVALILRVAMFLVSLYALYSLAFALSALPAYRHGVVARLRARTRYALWQLERQASGDIA